MDTDIEKLTFFKNTVKKLVALGGEIIHCSKITYKDFTASSERITIEFESIFKTVILYRCEAGARTPAYQSIRVYQYEEYRRSRQLSYEFKSRKEVIDFIKQHKKGAK